MRNQFAQMGLDLKSFITFINIRSSFVQKFEIPIWIMTSSYLAISQIHVGTTNMKALGLTAVTPLRSSSRLNAWRAASNLSAAVDETIKNLRAHPMLLAQVLKQGDESIRQAVLNKELIATAFREADTDGDGTISASEQTAYLKVRRYGNSFSEYGNIPTPSTATAAPAAKGTEDAEPTPLQLRRYSLLQFLPFVVFGILDNGIMVIAGNQIDDMFGVMLGLSTMASAGLGNLISDVVGVRAAGSVEDGAERMLPDPRLTEAQAQNPKVRFVSNYAKIVGISLGCLIGLTPLLFMEDEDTRQLRKLYEAIDANKDGGVSLGELENSLNTLGSSFDVSFSRATIEKIFNEIDSDRSKLLSFDEFKAFAMRWKTLEVELLKKA